MTPEEFRDLIRTLSDQGYTRWEVYIKLSHYVVMETLNEFELLQIDGVWIYEHSIPSAYEILFDLLADKPTLYDRLEIVLSDSGVRIEYKENPVRKVKGFFIRRIG